MSPRRCPLALLLALALGAPAAPAQQPAGPPREVPPLTLERSGPPPRTPTRSIHPPVPLLDAAGDSVRDGRRPLSLMKSCGDCHDTAFIAEHNYHALVGLDELVPPGRAASGRPWDTGPGLFGRWSPLTYRWLSPPGAPLDLGTADWIRRMGPRHVGGGPARFSRQGGPLSAVAAVPGRVHPDSHVRDPASGRPRPWDWQASGTVELNCLLCHMDAPDNAARVAELEAGRFRWASTATLLGSGLVERDGAGYRWNATAFDAEGRVAARSIGISDPRDANCRLCHGKACRCTDPVVFENSLDNWAVETTGTVFSAERMAHSGMNLAGKEGLVSPWDVHAERLVGCADCHHAMNNPARNRKETTGTRPAHLAYDARRLSTDAYLLKPDHDLVKGRTAQGTVARRLDGSMRQCRDCHRPEAVHDFLPYKRLHFDRVGCQSCHIPRVHAPARKVTDWTLFGPDRGPLVSHRGVEGPVNEPTSLIRGYRPVLLMQKGADGDGALAPHNLISSWFWVGGDPPHPVRRHQLVQALFAGDAYHPALVAALDADGDGRLAGAELRLDSEAKAAAVAERLRRVGVAEPRIRGEIQPYTIGHGVGAAPRATRCCLCCHGFDSLITRDIELAGFVPGGVLPQWVGDSGLSIHGELERDAKGRLVFAPSIDPDAYYVHGSDRLRWLDVLGILVLLGTVLGVSVHGGLRLVTGRRRRMGGGA